MAYTSVNDSRLPTYVKKLDEAMKKRWVLLYNKVEEKEGKTAALVAANTLLKSKVKKQGLVARSQDTLNRIVFTVDTTGEFIQRSDSGEYYITAYLQDGNVPDYDGVTYDPKVLKRWADQVNSNLPVGDIDHTLFNELLESGASDEFVKQAIKAKKGIARAVKAIYDKGKLALRILVDGRYRELLKKVKGLSVEAFVTSDEKSKVTDGDLLGFSFIVNGNQANPGAVIVDGV